MHAHFCKDTVLDWRWNARKARWCSPFDGLIKVKHVNGRAYPFEVSRHPQVVDIPCESVRCPFVNATTVGQHEFVDEMALISDLCSINHGIMGIQPDRPVVVGD